MMESNVGVHGDSGAAETDGSSQMVNGNGSAQTSDNVDLRRQYVAHNLHAPPS